MVGVIYPTVFDFFSLPAAVLNCFPCNACKLQEKISFFRIHLTSLLFKLLLLLLFLLLHLLFSLSFFLLLKVLLRLLLLVALLFSHLVIFKYHYCTSFCSFVFLFCFVLLFFLLLIKQLFSHMKQLRLVNFVCLTVCLFCFRCFLNGNHSVKIHNLIAFLQFPKRLQF